MKHTACCWCSSLVEVPDTYNDIDYKAVCSKRCLKQEQTFCECFSDAKIWKEFKKSFGYSLAGKEKHARKTKGA